MIPQPIAHLHKPPSTVEVTGLAEHSVAEHPISTVSGPIETSSGPIIGLSHQYANLGTGTTIHSTNQLKSFVLEVIHTLHILGGL